MNSGRSRLAQQQESQGQQEGPHGQIRIAITLDGVDYVLAGFLVDEDSLPLEETFRRVHPLQPADAGEDYERFCRHRHELPELPGFLTLFTAAFRDEGPHVPYYLRKQHGLGWCGDQYSLLVSPDCTCLLICKG